MRRRLSIAFALVAIGLSASAQPTQGSGVRGAQQRPTTPPPPGWRETMDKSLDLTINKRPAEVIALWEQWVKQHPDFADGIAMLGGSYENMGLSIRAVGAPDAVAKSSELFEKAASCIRRAITLKGDAAGFGDVRGLIDLYGPLRLNRPAEHVQLARDGATRFSTDPHAHGYAICAIAESGAPIDDAVRAARASVPQTAVAQSDLGGTLFYCARDWRGSDRIAALVLEQAVDFTNRALLIAPSDPSALKLRADILLEQAKRQGK